MKKKKQGRNLNYKTYIYGRESSTANKTTKKRIEVTQIKYLKEVKLITRRDKVRNEEGDLTFDYELH